MHEFNDDHTCQTEISLFNLIIYCLGIHTKYLYKNYIDHSNSTVRKLSRYILAVTIKNPQTIQMYTITGEMNIQTL